MEDDQKDADIRMIIEHTLLQAQPLYDLKQIQKHVKNIYYKQNEAEKATVVKTE